MARQVKTEKGEMDILGRHFVYEMIRSKEPSAFGIQESRIYELNLWRNGTLTADYNKKWLKKPDVEDRASQIAVNELVREYGAAKEKKMKKEVRNYATKAG